MDRQGKPVDRCVKITSFKFEVTSIHAGEVHRDQTHYLIRHFKPHEGWTELDLPASAMFGPMMAPTLANLGVVIHDAELFRGYIREAVDALEIGRAHV